MTQALHAASNTALSTPPLPAVNAELSFIRPQDVKPSFHSSALTGGAPKLLFETDTHPVTIADLRPIADQLSLDLEGFELHQHQTTVRDFYDDAEVEQVYFPEIEALLQRHLGASRVVIFDSTRRADSPAGAPNRDGARGPASRIHVDYTKLSGPQRLRDILGNEEADRLTKSGARIVQVNVWRPIRGPVLRAPLALADASSVRADDLIATDQVFPDRVGEIYHLAYDPDQRWYYAPRMTRDEVLLIKGWDSLNDGRARFTPHSAVNLPDTPADAPPRESIEIRTLVIIE